MRINRYILILSSLSLLLGCIREQPEVIEEPRYGDPLPFSVSVETDPLTRASFNGPDISSGNYVFATGDKLYVSDADGNISGILELTSGVGSSSATFDGDLTPVANFVPTADTDLTITLVGASQSSFFTITNGRVTGSPSYPSTIPASITVAELVQNYSHFTANVKYGIRNFTLNQQTVFLNFRLDLLVTSITGSPSTVNVDIKSADGNTTLRRVSGVTVGGNASIAELQFTTVFPAGTSLQGAQIIVDNGSGIHCTPDFAADLTLAANKYYSVARTNVEPFTIEAPSTGTGASITLLYANVQYRRESGDWQDYESTIVLSAGQRVSLRAKGSSYDNNNGNNPLFTTDNPVNIYGDIMSLMCNNNWERQYEVGNRAFFQTFKGVSVNIPNDKELLLSAVELGTRCYQGMFSGCTALTKAPVLPATTMAERCYYEMFKGCTQLVVAPALPATSSAAYCYQSMFEGCTALTTPPSLIPFTTIVASACRSMFSGCTNLTSSPDLSCSEVEQDGCREMFYNCTKLATPPSSLPAKTLGKQAYYKMFYNCQKLERIPVFPNDPNETYTLTAGTNGENGQEDGLCFQMFFQCHSLTTLEGKKLYNSSTELKLGCFQDMFSTCNKLETVPEDFLPATSLAPSCYRGMFQKCPKLTRAPDLLAETLVDHCYRFMFNSCSKLNYIKCLATNPSTITGNNNPFTRNWVTSVASSGTFVKKSNVTTWASGNVSGTPSGWTETDYVEPTP